MIDDLETLTDDLVRDSLERVASESRDRAIRLALVRYSADRPREVVEDVISAGGAVLPLPLGWTTDASVLRGIEFPVGAEPLPASAWRMYRTPTGVEIQLTGQRLNAGDAVRLTYAAAHVVSDTEDTIPLAHREAVACYAASLLAEQLAALHANAAEPTIAADSVNYSHPAREWARRAKDLRNRYFATLGVEITAQGVEKPRMEAAGAIAQLDLTPSWRRPPNGLWLGRR
ncbi:hypothetical protein [Thauera sinica]|uniref:Uncharacterized protein n=1 Tax=Thauera sinica TaxID=2665146 RepID=A0ABW1ARB4_9RHOO|nr:hypothetical protein [Thauera sp. K11]ATE60165.1 hypothetical protein CCZ27_09580 [Thauera sp. K11]